MDTVLQWLKCKCGGPGTLCGLRCPYHTVGGPLHSIWGPVIWLLYSCVMLTIPQQYWKLAYVMKLQHTFKILQQRYFVTVNMANIGALKLEEKNSAKSVPPRKRYQLHRYIQWLEWTVRHVKMHSAQTRNVTVYTLQAMSHDNCIHEISQKLFMPSLARWMLMLRSAHWVPLGIGRWSASASESGSPLMGRTDLRCRP